jgi:hypothetical protein
MVISKFVFFYFLFDLSFANKVLTSLCCLLTIFINNHRFLKKPLFSYKVYLSVLIVDNSLGTLISFSNIGNRVSKKHTTSYQTTQTSLYFQITADFDSNTLFTKEQLMVTFILALRFWQHFIINDSTIHLFLN